MTLTPTQIIQNNPVSAMALRDLHMDTPIQEGVVGAADLKVSQATPSANMSVDIAAGAAWVKGDYSTRQGLYHVFNNAPVNVGIGNNSAGNPRVDQVALRINDTTDGGSPTDDAQLIVLVGTATAGANLTNRVGAAALPGGCLRLADVLVPAGASSITNANIRDRRPWARGARFLRSTAVEFPVSTATGVVFITRLEVSGAPVCIHMNGTLTVPAANNQNYTLGLYINAIETERVTRYPGTTTQSRAVDAKFIWTPPAPGCYEISLAHSLSAGTQTLAAGATMSVDEWVQPTGNNE